MEVLAWSYGTFRGCFNAAVCVGWMVCDDEGKILRRFSGGYEYRQDSFFVRWDWGPTFQSGFFQVFMEPRPSLPACGSQSDRIVPQSEDRRVCGDCGFILLERSSERQGSMSQVQERKESEVNGIYIADSYRYSLCHGVHVSRLDQLGGACACVTFRFLSQYKRSTSWMWRVDAV